MTNKREMERYLYLMANHLNVNGKKIKWMDKELNIGLMDNHMLVN